MSSITGGERVPDVRLAFVVRRMADVPDRRFALAADEVLLLNPNTGTLPLFRSRRDAEVTLACYRRHPVLVRDRGRNTWGLRFGTLFHMTNDSGLFLTGEELAGLGADFNGWTWEQGQQCWLPLYEAKMVSHWNHRYSTYAGATQAQLNVGSLPRFTDLQLDNSAAESRARVWVAEDDVVQAMPEGWDRAWLLGWRDITNSGNERTFVPTVLPRSAVGNSLSLALPADPSDAPLLQVLWSSFPFDYVARQKASGSHMNYFTVKQLACPEPAAFDDVPSWSDAPLSVFVRPRVLELAYTSHRLAQYAIDVLQGVPGETDP